MHPSLIMRRHFNHCPFFFNFFLIFFTIVFRIFFCLKLFYFLFLVLSIFDDFSSKLYNKAFKVLIVFILCPSFLILETSICHTGMIFTWKTLCFKCPDVSRRANIKLTIGVIAQCLPSRLHVWEKKEQKENDFHQN